jgi:aldose 1-epimerase
MPATSKIELRANEYRLVLEPGRGGSVAAFDFGDFPLFRTTCGQSILDTGCFPLVPFSNRIAHGSFGMGDQLVQLAPNFPGGAHPHPLHGFGWLSRWDVIDAAKHSVTLRHAHQAGEWPWPYYAEQRFDLSAEGLTHSLSLRNLGATPMPAGLGFHPYFPRDAQTRLTALHSGEWQTTHDGLPISLTENDYPVDWWQGEPVESRIVDTVYTGRSGNIGIAWPDQGLQLRVAPSPNLPCTVVYTPAGADFFCVEPVSHATDAINRSDISNPMVILTPGDTLSAAVRYRVDRC